MRKLDIDTNVPISAKGGPGTLYDWPFAQMERGDSFAIPIEHASALRRAIMRYVARTKIRRYITRTQGESIRCWRVE